MPFKRNNTDVQKRNDRGSKSDGKRRRSSYEIESWTPPRLALLGHYLVLEGANFWVPSYSRRELDRRSLSFAETAHGHGR